MPSTERGARSFLKNISEFSIRLHNAIITSPDYENKNVALSPFSLHTLFALIFWGTRGNCSKELGKAINVEDIDRNTVSSYYEHLSKSFADIAGKVFQEAIKIFLRQPYYFDIEFEEITNLFRTKNEVMDFFYGQAPILTIDSWVKDNTNCKVNDIMSGSTIGLQSELIAVVGNYFNGIWDQRFEKAKVDSGTFWLTNNESIETEMISVAGSFGYMRIEDLEAEVLVLPYENQQMSLLIIMPATADGIDDLEKNLQCEHIFNVINSATEQMIDVKLPRCRVEFKASMQPIMEKMGMHGLYSEYADFAYLLDVPEAVRLSFEVHHKSIFEIDIACCSSNQQHMTGDSSSAACSSDHSNRTAENATGSSNRNINNSTNDTNSSNSVQNSHNNSFNSIYNSNNISNSFYSGFVNSNVPNCCSSDEHQSNGQFYVQHPFMFVVRWNQFNLPIQLGTIRKPITYPYPTN